MAGETGCFPKKSAGCAAKIFKNRSQYRKLGYHHEPVSVLAQRLIFVMGFTLFNAIAQWHNELVRLGAMSAKALTKELELALEEDLPWEPRFHSG